MRSLIAHLVPLTAALSLSLFSSLIHASELEKPESDPILSITGQIDHTNEAEAAIFDRSMLERFQQQTLEVTTPWTDGIVSFSGPLLSDVLSRVGAQDAKTLKAIALNDYAVEIPVEDARKYPVILAMNMNGKALSVRGKGPLWVIYPWTEENKLLRNEVYHSRSIWQLSEIEVLE